MPLAVLFLVVALVVGCAADPRRDFSGFRCDWRVQGAEFCRFKAGGEVKL